jgi:hypothetical protein
VRSEDAAVRLKLAPAVLLLSLFLCLHPVSPQQLVTRCGGAGYELGALADSDDDLRMTGLVAVDSGLLLQINSGQLCRAVLPPVPRLEREHCARVRPARLLACFLNMTGNSSDCQYTFYISTNTVCPDSACHLSLTPGSSQSPPLPRPPRAAVLATTSPSLPCTCLCCPHKATRCSCIPAAT